MKFRNSGCKSIERHMWIFYLHENKRKNGIFLWFKDCNLEVTCFPKKPQDLPTGTSQSFLGGRMNVSSRLRAGVTLFAIVALLSMSLLAQSSPDGRIAGIVKDSVGAVVKGAKVIVTNQGTGTASTLTTTGEGTFLAPSLPAGLYNVRIEAAGFTIADYKDVKVNAGQEYSLNSTLKVGAAGDIVEVTAGQELINTTSSEVSHTVSQAQLRDLPLNGR